ncbi:hypothetical protein GIB67_019825 [Kingdonia uniflora]|uniref:N-acetyltransferase domain-containing protein n=1 Tax=Kingdonia uniflora TaxID=39325 RepID=A0A7J7MK67_9MAGN|nr:hypothetical protein GIB67_019825 [Kingdonia uniflora]
MVCIRQATKDDLLDIQECDQFCFPQCDSFPLKYYLSYNLWWPQLFYVAEDNRGRIVGYIQGEFHTKNPNSLSGEKEQTTNTECYGRIANLGVICTHRNCGIATRLMTVVHNVMEHVFAAEFVSLHVHKGNHAAFNLYNETLGYKIYDSIQKYYSDGADAFVMKKQLK